MHRTLCLTALSAALLAACGGGDGPTPAPAVTERAQALTSVGARELFDWAQYKYPDLLAGASSDYPTLHLGVQYQVRAIPAKNAYLGVTGAGEVFVLAPFTNGALQGYGPSSGFSAQVQADRCKVYPGSCGSLDVPATLNACTMPATQALKAGNRLLLNYEISGATTTSSTVEAVVVGPVNFDGQPAILTSATTTTTSTGSVTSTEVRSDKTYQQAGIGEFTRTLGGEAVYSVAGHAASSRTIYYPPAVNDEDGLGVGQTLTKTTNGGTTTTTMPGPLVSVSDFVNRETFTFEARESIDVRGNRYDSCRYRITTPAGAATLKWVVVGKGVAVRIQSMSARGATTTELVSGSFNGEPI